MPTVVAVNRMLMQHWQPLFLVPMTILPNMISVSLINIFAVSYSALQWLELMGLTATVSRLILCVIFLGALGLDLSSKFFLNYITAIYTGAQLYLT